jgi:hypothetical protein
MKIHLKVERGLGVVVVDGHDISKAVARDGVEIDLGDLNQPKVTLTLLPAEFTIEGEDVLVDLRRRALAEYLPTEGDA